MPTGGQFSKYQMQSNNKFRVNTRLRETNFGNAGIGKKINTAGISELAFSRRKEGEIKKYSINVA